MAAGIIVHAINCPVSCSTPRDPHIRVQRPETLRFGRKPSVDRGEQREQFLDQALMAKGRRDQLEIGPVDQFLTKILRKTRDKGTELTGACNSFWQGQCDPTKALLELTDQIAQSIDNIVEGLVSSAARQGPAQQTGIRLFANQGVDLNCRRAAAQQEFAKFGVDRLTCKEAELGRSHRSPEDVVGREKIRDQIVPKGKSVALHSDEPCTPGSCRCRRVVRVENMLGRGSRHRRHEGRSHCAGQNRQRPIRLRPAERLEPCLNEAVVKSEAAIDRPGSVHNSCEYRSVLCSRDHLNSTDLVRGKRPA